MHKYPGSLQATIDALSLLPGVGPRSAERYAYYLLKNNPTKARQIASSLANLHDSITFCPVTFALIEKGEDQSPLYTNPKRDKTIVAVVAEPFDIYPLEDTGQYTGTYHVLGGLLSPIDNIGPDNLHIKELINRIKTDNVKEIIVATNASVEGESTALYLQNALSHLSIEMSRLARGLPIGIDLAYADQITLGRALEGRTKL